ncbi:hypothetical protein [Nonomuraea rubra]|uniref:hypothetical protein n=1 Tax=Nonomuraea rubra TaxID=46180 RepID=UPI0031EAF313
MTATAGWVGLVSGTLGAIAVWLATRRPDLAARAGRGLRLGGRCVRHRPRGQHPGQPGHRAETGGGPERASSTPRRPRRSVTDPARRPAALVPGAGQAGGISLVLVTVLNVIFR